MANFSSVPWSDQLRAIAFDRTSGASSITMRAGAALEALVDQCDAQDVRGLLVALAGAGRELIAGQPSMAGLFALVNSVVTAASACADLVAARAAAHDAARAFIVLQHEHQALIARLGGALLRKGTTVLTHSNSAAVVGALLRAQETGRAPRVICTESRPNREGCSLARTLHGAGIVTTLVLDAAAFDALEEADLVMLGGDSLALPGLFNKVGSAGLASAACARGKPCYALAGSEKVWPAVLGVPPHIVEQDPAEVWPDAPHGLRVINRYFDVTPWSAVSGVVTEQGLISGEGIVRLIQQAKVHPAVLDIV